MMDFTMETSGLARDPIIEKAFSFALKHHKTQRRKYTDEPYFVHLQGVALKVQETLREDITQRRISAEAAVKCVAAALLHDVIEDQPVSFTDLAKVFDEEIVEIVFWLTDPVSKEKGNRKWRKELAARFISRAPWMAQLVKIADVDNNVSSIYDHDREFAVTYVDEKCDLVHLVVTSQQWSYATQECRDFGRRVLRQLQQLQMDLRLEKQ